jgi:hypothetical protein
VTGRGLLPAVWVVTVVLAALALLVPHPLAAAQPRARPPAPSIDDVPRIDPNMVAVNRRTREALDACQARGPEGAGVLVVIAPRRDGRLGVSLHHNARGVCAYKVD